MSATNAENPDEPDLGTDLCGIRLANPVMTASGCLPGGAADALAGVAELGAVVTGTVTLDPLAGPPPPRAVETASGLLRTRGVQSPGVDGFLARDLPRLVRSGARVVASVAGTSLGEYAELARRLGGNASVSAVEVTLADGPGPGRRPPATRVVAAVRREVPRGVPVLVKLPAGPEVVAAAREVAEAGADGVVLVHALPGMAVDPARLRPALGSPEAVLSGPAVLPVALECVWRVHSALPDLQVVAAGGITTVEDVLACLAAGASAVQMGTALVHDPTAARTVVAGLAAELARRGLDGPGRVVGCAHLPGEAGP